MPAPIRAAMVLWIHSVAIITYAATKTATAIQAVMLAARSGWFHSECELAAVVTP